MSTNQLERLMVDLSEASAQYENMIALASLTDFHTSELIVLSERIEKLERLGDFVSDRLAFTLDRIGIIKAEISEVVACEGIGDEGKPFKPRFSNETARRAEIQRRLADHIEYGAYDEAHQAISKLSRLITHHVGHLHRLFQIGKRAYEFQLLGRRAP